MREILFRGKLLKNDKWCFGNLDVKVNGVCIITPDDTPLGVYGQVDPETVGQYTGLTDKNGTKIFEGDFCKDSLGHVFVVEWDAKNARFIGYAKTNGERYIIYIGREPKVEIIGNIHDNPDISKKLREPVIQVPGVSG